MIFAVLALAGLIASLFFNRRRVWVRTGNHPDGCTMVEFGLLARGEDHRLAGEYIAINKALHAKWLVPLEDAEQNSEQPQRQPKIPHPATPPQLRISNARYQ